MNKVNLIAMLAGLMISCLSVSTPVASQTVYRAVDELGNPAFTDRPEEYEESEAISITIAASDRKGTVSRQVSTTNDDEDNDVASTIREQHAAEDAAAQKEQADAMTSNCDVANKRLDKYKSARRLFRENDGGEREYLSDEETDTARNDAAESVKEWCGG